MLTLPLLFTLAFPVDAPLAETAQKAGTIIVAQRGKLAQRKLPRGTFQRVQDSFSVVAVLKGDPKLAGAQIWVDDYNWRFNETMHNEMAKGNTALPSVNAPRYVRLAKQEPSPKEQRILFLRVEDDGAYEPVVMDAVESVKHRKQVEAAIAAAASAK